MNRLDRERSLQIVLLLLTCLVMARAATLYVSQRGAGAIGNDPQTYVQMALDIAATHSPIHEFAIADKVTPPDTVNNSWYVSAFMTFGYQPICDFCSEATPVFASGLSWLLALAYWLGGEALLFMVPPLIGIAVLLATWYLCWCLFADRRRSSRFVIAVLAISILSLSKSQTASSLMPRSELATQLFLTIALISSIKAFRTHRIIWVMFAGVCMGIAYHIRHPAGVLFLVCLPLLGLDYTGKPRYWRHAAIACIAFVLVCLPDFIYHYRHFGSLLIAENPGSSDILLSKTLTNLKESIIGLGSFQEFGPFLVLAVLGYAYLSLKKEWLSLFVLSGWLLAFYLIHMPLRLTALFENSTRYIQPAFPAIAIAIAYAVTTLGQSTGRRRMSLGIVMIIVFGFIGMKLPYLNPTANFTNAAGGHLNSSEREQLEKLNPSLPENAVVLADARELGAIQMYSQRPTLFPWWRNEAWFADFVKQAHQRGWQLYLLGEPDRLANTEEPGSRAYLREYQWIPTANSIVVDGQILNIYQLQRE